jgi:hypothetical protein
MAFIAPVIGAVVSAVGAVGSFVAGLGAFGQALVGIGLSVAAGAIQKSITGKQEKQPGGVQFERQYGGAVPRQVAAGFVGVAGHDTYVNTFGPSNGLLQQIYTLSDYPCHGLSRVAIGGVWITLGAPDGTGARQVLSGDYANRMYIRFYDGTQTSAIDGLVANSNPVGRWTANHIGHGVCHVFVAIAYDKDKSNSFPDFFFEFFGARLYDWRKDSTVGGSGAHRWGDYSTHEFTENPVVIEYNYRRGLAWNGDTFCGMGMLAGDLPLDKWTAAANICDESAPYGTRYRCSILLDCTAEHGQNIEALQLACAAKTIDAVDGSWPLVGHDQAVVATITDDDLISTSPVRWRARRSMGDLVNAVSGNFPDPSQYWSMVGYETATSSALVTLDRRTRDIAIDFQQVPSKDQAAQLAGIYLEENRYEASAELVLRPRWQVLEAGDWIAWNSARYGNRVYQVISLSLASLDADGPRNVSVSLQEVDGSIYDGITAPDISVPWPPGEPVWLSEVQSFSLLPVSVAGADGRVLPGIRAAWETIDDETVTYVDLQYYPEAQPASVFSRRVPVSQTVVILVEGIVGLTQYRVKTRLITDPPRLTVWTSGELVTTLDISVNLADFSAGLQDLIETKFGADDAERQRAIDLTALAVAEQDLANYTNYQRLGRSLSLTEQRVTVSYKEEIQVWIGPGSAVATKLESLQAQVDDIGANLTVRYVAGALPAGAIASYEVQAKVSDGVYTATAAMRISAFGTPGAYTSRIDFEADSIVFGKAGVAGYQSIFLISGGNVYLRGDLIASGSITAAHLSVGTLSAISANMGTVTAGRMLSPDGKVDFNLTAGYLYFVGT